MTPPGKVTPKPSMPPAHNPSGPPMTPKAPPTAPNRPASPKG